MPLRAVATGATLVALALLLGGCPQTLSDDFVVAEDSATTNLSGGRRATTAAAPSGGLADNTESTSAQGGLGVTNEGSSAGGTSSLDASGGTSSSDASGGTSALTTSTVGGSANGNVTALHSCESPVVLSAAGYYDAASVVANLDTWDEVAPLSTWTFAFESDKSVVMNGRVSSFDDHTGNYAYGLTADGSGGWAAEGHNSRASEWGGGVALLIDCVDASSHTGISFRARGSSPAGKADLILRLSGVGNVQQPFQLTTNWKSYQLPFIRFAASSDSPGAWTDGSGIDRLAFAPELMWMNGVAVPGAFEIVVDDVGFY